MKDFYDIENRFISQNEHDIFEEIIMHKILPKLCEVLELNKVL